MSQYIWETIPGAKSPEHAATLLNEQLLIERATASTGEVCEALGKLMNNTVEAITETLTHLSQLVASLGETNGEPTQKDFALA